ncbi:protein-tyrosine phosphatase family protein [Roseiconus lacunae]|uniref:protein-tyrosine phosphatase family protein n=1 Tax=Roseiconus lacunae TaxID=2605694 RepID=UPI0011F1155A|nr:dual specificity protein phosphatase family protein [Roseiconus lacunae]
MHEIHPDLLWIGHAFDIREPRSLFDAEIAAVVDVAFEEPPAALPRQLVYCRFPLNDGGGNNPAVLLQSIQTLVDLLNADVRTIVACSAGMSRSPTVAAFALAAYLSQQPDEVLTRIASIKTLEIKPALWKEVEQIFPRIHSRRIN